MEHDQKVYNFQPIQLVLLPGVCPSDTQGKEYYQAAYTTWKNMWKKELLELDGSDELYSDNFTRQDYFITLFHGKKCAALISFRKLNLSVSVDREDSWFKIWPKDLLQNYSLSMSHGLMVSWFIVDPAYRRSQTDSTFASLEMSQRVTEMMSLFLLDAKAEISFAGVRNNRSVNKLFQLSGCKVAVPDIENHGVKVDLVTWRPADVEQAINKFAPETFHIWNNRLVYPYEPLVLSAPRGATKSAA